MKVTCGVPQDSVLSHADDTLVVAKGDTVDAVQERVNVALETVSDHIRGLGLCLSAEKTQAMVSTKCYGAALWPLYSWKKRPSDSEHP